MVDVVLFHAIMGLRAAEHAWADRMRATGHRVFTPDLFAGETAATIEAGFELEKRIGWDTIVARAADASADLPNDAVLAGISMGAGVAGGLWARRPATRGVLLLHGVCEVPADAHRGLPAQVHLAEPDPYESEEWVAVWQSGADAASLAAETFRYPAPATISPTPRSPTTTRPPPG